MPREFHQVIIPSNFSFEEIARAFGDVNRVFNEISVRLAYIQQGDEQDVINLGSKKLQGLADGESSGEVLSYDQIDLTWFDQSVTTTSSVVFNDLNLSTLTASRLVQTDATGGLASFTPGSHIANAETSHDMTGTGTISVGGVEDALDALGTKVNAILAAIETALIVSTA